MKLTCTLSEPRAMHSRDFNSADLKEHTLQALLKRVFANILSLPCTFLTDDISQAC